MRLLFRYFIAIVILSSLTIFSFAQPANNEACNAVNIAVENLDCEPTTTYSWTGATYSSSNGSTYCNGPDKRDVWYKFTVPANGEAKVSTANANGFFNMATELYKSTSCSALTILNESTEGFPCIYTNPYLDDPFRTYKNLTPGSTIYLRVFPLYYPDQHDGAIKICVANTSQMADDPCSAGFFPVQVADPLGQTCIASKLFSWSNTTLTPAIPNPDCIGNMAPANIRDAWFKVKVPASGKLFITSEYAGNSVAMQVLTATACNGTFTQVACQLTGTISLTVAPGSTIYVRLFAWTGGVVASGSAKICVAARSDVPAVNNSQGKVGIGIDSPFTKLQVVGSGYFHDKVLAGGDIEARGNLILKGNLVSSSGNSSIDVPNLKISGSSNFTGAANFSGANNFSGPSTFASTATFQKASIFDSISLGSKTGARVAMYGPFSGNHYGMGIQGGLYQFYTDAAAANFAFGYGNSNSFTERARIINTGEYGLVVNGRLQLKNGTNDINYGAGIWLFKPDNSAVQGFIGVYNSSLMGFYGGSRGWGLTYSTVNSNLGIGNANPTRPLSFPAELGEKILLYPGPNGEVGIGVYGNELRLHSDNPGAKVSFGTQDNNGVFTEVGKFEKNGNYALSVFGSIWANGTTYASDGRFKKNIEPLENSLDKILQLQGVQYQMNTDLFPMENFDSSMQVGLVAQEVEKIVPEVVSTGPGGYKAIDYAKLVPLLIESIKAQEEKINALTQKIERLEKKRKLR